jgi:hypothetical protein
MSLWTADFGDSPANDQSVDVRSQPGEFQSALSSGTSALASTSDHYSETVPGPRDPGVGLSSEDPTVDKPLSSGGQLPSRVPYVVIPETIAPHNTFDSAQKLPDLPYFGVVGTIGNRGGVDLYQLTLSAGAARLNFTLSTNLAGTSAPVEFELFDGSGRALGVWTSGSQGSANVQADLSNLPAGTTLFLGVSAGNSSSSGPTVQAASYQLWIDHEQGTTSSSAAAASGSSLTTGIMPVNASVSGASTGAGSSASGVDSQANPSSTLNSEAVGLVAVGSAAVRSVAPSGGLLSDADPTPPAARDFNAVVNRERDDQSTKGPTPVRRSESPPPVLTANENNPDALMEIHGPGGFPLVGALAVGHRRRVTTTEIGDFATGQAIGEPGPQSATELATAMLTAKLDSTSAEKVDTTMIEALNPRELTEYPVTVYSGLGLATVLTLNAVLSQPMAGFDYLPSRLDTESRSQSDWKDRRRKGSTSP